MLFRIVRGTGLAGSRGDPVPAEVRSFARCSTSGARRSCAISRRRSIPFVEDPSNADPRFARARVRHRSCRCSREENPRVAEALVALAAAARDVDAPAARDETLAALPRRVAVAVGRLRARGGTAAIDVAGGRRVEVSYGDVRVGPRDARACPRPAGPVRHRRPRGLPLGCRERSTSKAEAAASGARGAGGPPWSSTPICSTGRSSCGPAGRAIACARAAVEGSRKLSDLMIDAKIARGARAALPVVTSARDDLLFVPGLRPAEIARPDGAHPTRRAGSDFGPASI